MHIIAVLAGTPKDKLLRRAISLYNRQAKAAGIRNPDQPSPASISCVCDDGTYVAIDLDGYQRIYALLPGNRLKAVRHYPADIHDHYAAANQRHSQMPPTRTDPPNRLPEP